MSISSALTTALSGLRASALKANSAANNIANIDTPNYQASTVVQSTVQSGSSALSGGTAVNAQLMAIKNAPDMGTEIVRLIEADMSYRANASVARTASDMSRQTLDLTA